MAFVGAGDFDEAVDTCERAFAAGDDDPAVVEPLFDLLSARGDPARAAHGRTGVRRPEQTRGEEELAGLVVLIAGGPLALRTRIEADLGRAGVRDVRDVRYLPPAWEATRHERDVRGLPAGADIAVLIGRQIAHNTIAQVKAAADAAGVPVIVAETVSASAVRRAIARHLVAARGRERGDVAASDRRDDRPVRARL